MSVISISGVATAAHRRGGNDRAQGTSVGVRAECPQAESRGQDGGTGAPL